MTYIDSIQEALNTPAETNRIIIIQGVPAAQIQEVAMQIKAAVGHVTIKTRPTEPANRDFFPEYNKQFEPEDPKGVLFVVCERVFTELEWQKPDNSLRSLLASSNPEKVTGNKKYLIDIADKGGVITILAENPDYATQISKYFPPNHLDPYVSVHSFGAHS
jgi:hypothetical protein